jgi:hypothetical protein
MLVKREAAIGVAANLVARDAGQSRSAAAGLVLGALALVLSMVGSDWSAE